MVVLKSLHRRPVWRGGFTTSHPLGQMPTLRWIISDICIDESASSWRLQSVIMASYKSHYAQYVYCFTDIKKLFERDREISNPLGSLPLTYWERVTHICVSKLAIIESDNGLSHNRRQAIIWTNVEMLFIEPLGTKFSETFIKIQTFSFKKMHMKTSCAKWRASMC